MRSVRLAAPGGPEQLTIEEMAVPTPGEGEALVRVSAAAITRDELTWALDRLPATPAYEISGTVEALGPGTAGISSGDDVYALLPFDRDGGAADYVVAPAAVLAPKPRALGHVESAALSMGGLTAWQALFDHGDLKPGERVLVTGAHGGVGHLAVQLARWAGADLVVDGDADLALDTAGGEALAHARARRVVSVAEEPAPPGAYFVVEPSREQLVEIARLADEGALRPAVDSVFPLGEAWAAFRRLEARGKRGKVVLRVVES